MHSSLELGMFFRRSYNPRHISWDSLGDVFCLPNVGLRELASQKQKIQHWEGKSTTFCRYTVFAPGVLTYCDEDCSSSSFGDKTISLLMFTPTVYVP